jgi:hypothetical protein
VNLPKVGRVKDGLPEYEKINRITISVEENFVYIFTKSSMGDTAITPPGPR